MRTRIPSRIHSTDGGPCNTGSHRTDFLPLAPLLKQVSEEEWVVSEEVWGVSEEVRGVEEEVWVVSEEFPLHFHLECLNGVVGKAVDYRHFRWQVTRTTLQGNIPTTWHPTHTRLSPARA